MKQNLEKIFYLHFWLSMKTKAAAGGVPEITATSCVWRIGGKHLPPRQEMWILLPDDPPDRCNVAKRRLCDSQVRSRLLKFKSHFRKKVGSTGSLSGGWTNNFIGCTCNNHSKWLPWKPCTHCRWKVGVIFRRGEDSPVNVNFHVLWKNKSLEFVA